MRQKSKLPVSDRLSPEAVRSLTVYLLGVFMGSLDTNVLGPVLPLLAHGLHTTLAWAAWTVTVYTAAYVAFTVIAGPVGDKYGRRRMFMFGVALFGVGSVAAALSQSLWFLLLARALQGMGAGAVYPTAQAQGVGLFAPNRRGVALGIFGAVFGLSSVIGPNVGGALGQWFGWSSIFVFNVPLAVIVLWAARRLPESVGTDLPTPDWAGGIGFSGMVAGALLTLVVSGPLRWLLATFTLALGALFFVRQRRAASPFLNVRPLAHPVGLLFVAGTVLIGYDLSAAVFVPALAQKELGFSVFGSGLALMPAAVSGAFLAAVAGVLVDRIGPRRVLQIGFAAAVLGGAVLALPHLQFSEFVVAMVALGLATAFTVGAPPNRMAIAMYPEEQTGEALALISVFRAVGLAAGPVFLTLAAQPLGFTGMFGSVAAVSLVGLGIFFVVPDVRGFSRQGPATASSTGGD